MKKQNEKLPQIAWDFEGIEDLSLDYATLYEYARTSDKLRTAICKVLQTRISGRRIAEHILRALRLKSTARKRPYPDCFPDGVWRRAHDGLLTAMAGNYKLCHIIMHLRPDFPNPWMRAPITFRRNSDFSRVLCAPYRDEPFRPAPEYELSIFWTGATVKDIVASFEKWVRREAKNHPEMKGRGKAGQLPIAPLAWLAAYRLHSAGWTFEKAQEMLARKGASCRHHPFYKDKSGWSDAISKARKLLSRLDSGLV